MKNSMNLTISKLILMIVALFVFGCGGGGDSTSPARDIPSNNDAADHSNMESVDCSTVPTLEWVGDYYIKNQEDLDFLTDYTSVSGDLVIKDSALTNLDGLDCLLQVHGELTLANNISLTDINALSNLNTLGGLIIDNCPLTAITAFDRINGGLIKLTIKNTSSLETLEGLNGVTRIEYLYVDNNEKLNDLSALRNVEHVLYSISILNNENLESIDFDGAWNLIDLSIIDNNSLKTVMFKNLSQLQSMRIKAPSLESFNFPQLQFVRISDGCSIMKLPQELYDRCKQFSDNLQNSCLMCSSY